MINKAPHRLYFLNGGSFHFPLSPKQIMLCLLAFSYAGTAAEVSLAHAQDRFIPAYEWIPVIYPVIAAAAVIYYLLRPDTGGARHTCTAILAAGVIVGLLGVYFHVVGNSENAAYLWNFFIQGAPVLAPLVIAWTSLFGLALVHDAGTEVLLKLTALGFLLLAFTAYLDHAQTGFASVYTWIPVTGGIFAFCLAWLAAGLFAPPGSSDVPAINLFYAVMLLMIITGITGFILHVAAGLHATVEMPWARFIHYAPVMVPLLFAQMGLFAVLASTCTETAAIQEEGKA